MLAFASSLRCVQIKELQFWWNRKYIVSFVLIHRKGEAEVRKHLASLTKFELGFHFPSNEKTVEALKEHSILGYFDRRQNNR